MSKKQQIEFMDVKAVAEISGFSVSKIYQEINSNNLQHSRIGKKYRIQQSDVNNWMKKISGGKK